MDKRSHGHYVPRPSWAVHSSTFKQKLLWIDQSMSYILKKNSSEGKTLSEYLNQHNDKIAFEGHMHPID